MLALLYSALLFVTAAFAEEGACHLKDRSVEGNTLTFRDGSQWMISAEYEEEIEGWQAGDPLTVSLNYRPFATYDYWVKNGRKETYILANLFMGPEDSSKESTRIVKIFREEGKIFAENGVGFEICGSDLDNLAEWEERDPLILGLSNAWIRSYDLILINGNMKNYVRAKRL